MFKYIFSKFSIPPPHYGQLSPSILQHYAFAYRFNLYRLKVTFEVLGIVNIFARGAI